MDFLNRLVLQIHTFNKPIDISANHFGNPKLFYIEIAFEVLVLFKVVLKNIGAQVRPKVYRGLLLDYHDGPKRQRRVF